MQIDVRQVPILRRGVVLEVHMVKADVAVFHSQRRVSLRVGDLGLLVQHLHDTLAAGDGAGQDHQHHGHHHQRHQDLAGVGEEGQQIAGQQGACRHLMAAQPHKGHDGAAHDQDHEGHEHHHKAEGPLRRVAELVAAGAEFLLLLVLPDEGFHHADGVQVLLHHQIQLVGGVLQRREERPHIADDDDHRHRQQRYGHQKHLTQAEADLHGLDQRRHQHHRCADAYAHSHEQRHLHRRHVVGQAGDEAGGGEMLDVGKGKPLHLLILRLPDIGAEAHGGLCRHHRRAYAASQRCHGHQEHLQPRQQDIAPVAVGDAHVHDGAHGLGQLQLQNRLPHRAQYAQQDIPPIAPCIRGELFQHTSSSSERFFATRRRSDVSSRISSGEKPRSNRSLTSCTMAVNLS